MADTTVAGAAPSEDAIREILARLEEPSTLVRCAATCRRWRALAAEPAVLRRLWPDPDRSFVGVFTDEWRRGEGVSFVPGPGSALGAGRRLLSSFIPDVPGVLDSVQPLASHHGLLLVRLLPREPGTMQLAVCDPLAATWDVLPALRVTAARYFLGYAITAATGGADRSSSSSPSNFRVLVIRTVHEVAGEYILHAFSSGQPSWSAPTKFPGHVEYSLDDATIAHADAAVCHGGVAHWLFKKSSELIYILGINSETGHVAAVLIRIPGKRDKQIRLTTTADGTLLSLCIYDGDRRFEIWEQQQRDEDGTVSWIRAKVLKLRLPLEGARLMCLGAGSRRLLMMDCHQRVQVLHLEGGAMEEMEDEFYDPNLIAVPMEIDWPSFLMSRLGRLV
ncbi:hypothetical protein QYE76_061200 [Lolium multiflorum]|uniref:F-box domain-containing protein n=1 Tax=Lolium multiflorum TaxID=4521 RepID=A0AAD8S2R2_LOLMU|nr:hypothetical protein QYE76_061200 [Lolium multiflorum]